MARKSFWGGEVAKGRTSGSSSGEGRLIRWFVWKVVVWSDQHKDQDRDRNWVSQRWGSNTAGHGSLVALKLSQRPSICQASQLTWWLCWARMEVTGLLRNWFQEWVTPTDKILPLVTLDIPHPHANSAGFCALGGRNKSSFGKLKTTRTIQKELQPFIKAGRPRRRRRKLVVLQLF